MTRATRLATWAGLGVLLAVAPADASGVNWSSVPGKPVVLFYPGQSSYEWALTPATMSGADDFRRGKNCGDCHIGKEKEMGPQIVDGQPRAFKTGALPGIEPAPIAGKPGAVAATVKVAHDEANLYVHLDFTEGAQPDARQDPAYATKVSVMFNNGKVPEANRAGCWAACHEDLTGMPSAAGAVRSMYLPKSHARLTRTGAGDTLAAPDQIARLQAEGYQLEYWLALLNPGQPARPATQIVFEKRAPAPGNVVTAQANWAGGAWSVTLGRPLNPGPPFSAIVAGTVYYVAFAIHAGHTANRFHYVSVERSLTLDGGNADLVAGVQ